MTLFDGLRAAPPPGVVELVPAACTVLIRFDPMATDRARLAGDVARIDLSAPRMRSGELFEIPIVYDGEDLDEVARLLGWTVEEVVHRHKQATFTVAFTGFAPGFAYMTCDDAGFDVPRRKSPRVKVPAGSVALAGRFAGIYPSESPGGWQILGTTPVEMWDAGRARPALLAPGDRVRFREVAAGGRAKSAGRRAPEEAAAAEMAHGEGLRVTRCDRPALFQDGGRPGRADQGVGGSGALDRHSFAEANLCVGNPRDAAVLEVVFGGLTLRAGRPVTLAVTGAPCPLVIRAGNGRMTSAPLAAPFALDAGDELSLGAPAQGVRSYVALRGGFAVDMVLGSAATDTLARVGPAPVQAGDVLVPAERPAAAVDPGRACPAPLPRSGEVVALDVALGPRTDWFTAEAVEAFFSGQWQVTAESSRVGVRLYGDESLQRRDDAELPSEGVVAGAIQVPHSGQPVLFLADHPLTGGYPVIAVVARHHLDLAGQIPAGAYIRFNPIAAFDPQEIESTAERKP